MIFASFVVGNLIWSIEGEDGDKDSSIEDSGEEGFEEDEEVEELDRRFLLLKT